jgi:uncharacterized protein YcbX
MLGEEMESAEVGASGLSGDRGYALRDRGDGKIASAKNPRKWNLFAFRAAYAEPALGGASHPRVRITLPDGVVVDSDAPDIAAILSRAVGRPVTLESVPPREPMLEEYWPDIEGLPYREAITDEATLGGTFFDAAPIHLLTSATMRRLRESLPGAVVDARRFRPNVVIDMGDASGFLEDAWARGRLAIGPEVRLDVTRPCVRCVMTTLPQDGLPGDSDILRAAARHNRGCAGVYASVARGGTIRRSDVVTLEKS